jgi:hypothetical protein
MDFLSDFDTKLVFGAIIPGAQDLTVSRDRPHYYKKGASL